MLTRYDIARFAPKHFGWSVDGKVAHIVLNRPEKKNPLTFESYAELRDLFRDLCYVDQIKAVVITGAAGISARAATCMKSSARWSAWKCPICCASRA
jgi:1,4-dihydroxy-2-naphthoyl-CoA synthase